MSNKKKYIYFLENSEFENSDVVQRKTFINFQTGLVWVYVIKTGNVMWMSYFHQYETNVKH